MNPLTLIKTIARNYFFVLKRTSEYGDAVRFTDEEAHQFLENLKTNPFLNTRFVIAANNKTLKIMFHHNADKFLHFKEPFTVENYFRMIHLDYLEEYLKWGDMVYSYAENIRESLAPLKQNYRITFPMKLKSGVYHWVLMEAYPLQLDANNNLIAHLNIYTILSEYNPKEKFPLVGDIWDNNERHDDWSHELWKKVNIHRAFILTPQQSRIVNLLKDNLELNNAEIAEQLGKKKNTIDVQNKQILSRARDCYPGQKFQNIKDLVLFLKEMEFFQEQFIKEDAD